MQLMLAFGAIFQFFKKIDKALGERRVDPSVQHHISQQL